MRKPTSFLIDRWRDKGPVALSVLYDWRMEDGWVDSWLPHCEEAFAGDEKKLLEIIEPELSIVERATLEVTKNRLDGKSGEELLEQIEKALKLAKDPDMRELKLEGRLRMERGLAHIECGDMDAARDDLNWAETRLKSVCKAERDHDISLLNKAAFHILVDEPLMALHVYSEIPREGVHVPETVAFSRYGAAQISAHLGQFSTALRHSWVSYKLAIESSLEDLVWSAGTTFLAIGAESLDDQATSMDEQVKRAKPRDADEELPDVAVSMEDYLSVFDSCIEIWDFEVRGAVRHDLMGLLSAAIVLDKMNSLDKLLLSPELVEDPFLIAAIIQISTEEDIAPWQKRLTTLMNLSD